MIKGKKAVLKISFIILALIIIGFLVAYASGVLAGTHTADVTIDRNSISCDEGIITFTVNIFNNGPDAIKEVRIYNDSYNGYFHNIPPHEDFSCGAAPSGWKLIDQHPDFPYCQYQALTASYYIGAGKDLDFTFDAEVTNESSYAWGIETYDIQLAWQPHEPSITVDCTAPETVKHFAPIGTYITKNGVEWIDGITTIKLEANDWHLGDHDSGIEKIYYKNTLVDDDYCYEPETCDNAQGSGNWTETEDNPVTFQKENEESCHLLEFYAIDGVGNEEEINKNCFFVDLKAPIPSKDIGQPNIPCDNHNNGDGDGECVGTPQTCINYDESQCNAIPSCDWEEEEWCEGIPEPESCINYDPEQCDIIPGCDWDYEFQHCYGTPQIPCSEIENIWPGKCYETPGCYWDFYSECEGIPDSCEAVASNWPQDPEGKCLDTPGCEWIENGDDGEECGYWVRDHVTEIELDCEDQQPHPSGDEEVCYIISLNDANITNQYCPPEGLEEITQEGHEGEWCCSPAPKTIIFEEDSLHDLEYFCRDAVDKKSVIDIEWFKVDSQPPIIDKTMFGSYLGDCPPEDEEDVCYVADDGSSGVIINVWDDETYGHAVGGVSCRYVLWWIIDEETCEEEGYNWNGELDKCVVESDNFAENIDIIFTEDSTHELYIHCEDALGNFVEDEEVFLVDSEAPETYKTYVDGEGEELPPYFDEGQREYIDTAHKVNLTAYDAKVGVEQVRYRISGSLADSFCEPENCGNWMETLRPDMGEWNTYEQPFGIDEESCHVIEYSSIDKLGNEEDIKWQCVFVDKTKPETTKYYEPDAYVDENGWEYIDTQHQIILDADDVGPHPSGVAETQYRISGSLADSFCEPENCGNWMETLRPDMGEWNAYEQPFGIDEESCHVIEYSSIDNVGKTEDIKWQCVFVDKTPPIIEKTYEPDAYVDENGWEYIDTQHQIVINVYDPEPHPSGVAETQYRVTLVDDVACQSEQRCQEIETDGGEFNVYEGAFGIDDESCHLIEIEAEDNVGKTAYHRQCVFVDKTKPETTKRYVGPQYPNPITEETQYPHYIDGVTLIELTPEDQGQHPSGIQATYWRNEIVENDYCLGELDCEPIHTYEDEGWNLYTEPFTKDEESCHMIEYYSVDNVDKKEEVKAQCVFVDNTAPTPNKTVGEPRTVWDGSGSVFYPEETQHCWDETGEEIECWKVTLMTPITLDCIDPQPHPVDQEHVCFQVGVDGDDETESYCDYYGDGEEDMNDGYCCVEDILEEFMFLEETEHNLKYYCEDALGNSNEEDVDEEKFKVEGTRFEIPIYKKWNLISVPVVLLNDDPEEVFNNTENITSVWTYDPEHIICGQDWCVWSPNPSPDNLRIEPGWGYWVMAEDNDLLVIGGSLMSPATTPPTRNLVAGWNLIGHYGLDSKEVYCSLFSLIDTTMGYPRWSALFGFDALTDEFVGLDVEDETNPGEGYWAEMDIADLYTPSTTCWGL